MPVKIVKRNEEVGDQKARFLFDKVDMELANILSSDLSKRITKNILETLGDGLQVFEIKREKFDDGKALFDEYYGASDRGAVTTEIVVKWEKHDTQDTEKGLKEYIIDIIASNLNNEPKDLVIRFHHCMEDDNPDGSHGEYYLLAEMCKKSNEQNKIWDLTTLNKWITLKQNGDITLIAGNDINEALEDRDNYKNHVYYYSAGGTSTTPKQKIADDTNDPTIYIKSVSFPWLSEIFQMCSNNQPQGGNRDVTKIGFTAYTVHIDNTSVSLINKPHGLAIYAIGKIDGGAEEEFINDDDYVTLLYNKAANFATLCEPNCATYHDPS